MEPKTARAPRRGPRSAQGKPRGRPNRRRTATGGPRRSSLGFWCGVAVAVLLALNLALLVVSRPNPDGDRLRLDGFVSLAEANRIRSAEILDKDAYVVGSYVRRDGSLGRYNLPFIKESAAARDRLVALVLENRIPSRVNQQLVKGLAGPASVVLPSLILIIVFIYFVAAFREGSGLFSTRSGARMSSDDDVPVTFADVAGQSAAVAELREVSEFLSETHRFAELGAQIPRGILLFGPPGCGKTLLARALAGESGAAFYSISGSDFVEMYVGVGAARVRSLFKEARENAPAIVFIDELDSVGRRRTAAAGSSSGGSAEEQGQALNQLLAEIDGFSPAQGVILVGATNRPDVLDPALLRPGRFDRGVGLELPDEQGREEILAVHARSKPMAEGVDLAKVAHDAVGMNGADLASVMNEAALLAARARRPAIEQEDLTAALARIREAPERQRRLAVRDRSVGQTLLGAERNTFADVAGLDDAIEELAEVREYLADPARFERIGARIPTGYLLSGPPGSGKTLLARAVAGEANAAFISAAGTEFVEVFLGEGAGRVRDLFAQARATAPAVVFIDELDAMGTRRGGMADHTETAQTLNQLLVELDGVSGRSGVIVMAATNRPDILDPALVRPGRFDRAITLDLPDRDARRAILEVHAKSKRLGGDVDLDAVARLTRGASGADLASIMNEAALLSARRGLEEIGMEVIDEAFQRVATGIAGGRVLSDEDRRAVAYHEAGHALVARVLPGGRFLHKVSIVSHGSMLGMTSMPESDDRVVHSRSVLMERMATLLGGRAAEQIVFGEPGDGAANDLMSVATLAQHLVARLGMSEAVGAINYADDDPAGNGTRSYSEETARLIDSEARRLVNEAEGLAREVLMRSREALDRVAEALLEKETLTLAEVEQIAGPAPPRLARSTPLGTAARR